VLDLVASPRRRGGRGKPEGGERSGLDQGFEEGVAGGGSLPFVVAALVDLR